MKHRNLHQQVRVIYRACRRIYGVEKTQDECLKVFKIVYPEQCRLEESVEERESLPENLRLEIQKVTKSWHPQKKLRELIERVDSLLVFDYERKELIELLKDITPVVMRIRKLTPRECFRLMGVRNEDIDTIQASGLSKSAQYKLAGNSIVCGTGRKDKDGNYDGVLFNIFRKLFIDTEMDIKKGEPIQLTLF